MKTQYMPLKKKEIEYIRKKYKLTARETDVIKAVLLGKDNRAIAESIGIETNTAKAHLRNIYLKTGVNTKIQLILRFFEDVSAFLRKS
ncbi:MAG: helix-turn-helix transcriptional regulator [Planctomycetota bacterium]